VERYLWVQLADAGAAGAGMKGTTRKTTRKPKTTRVVRTRAGGEWTEAAYFQFIRSGLRQLSRRWPPVTRLVWLQARRRYLGPNKRQKWEYQCAICLTWGLRTDMQADHIVPCGPLRTLEDLPAFVGRLLCEVEGLRILCTRCHAARGHG
jgi:5-methylcytosine-specific restriction endonuclease McrA